MPPPVKKVAKVGAIGVGTGVAVFAVPPLLGFTASGVAAGSVAAAIQSAVYGAAVPAGSLFSIMQSVGATATIVPALVAGASATGIAGAVEAGQGQGQGPDDNGEQREDGDKEAQEDKENEDLEKQSEGENQNPVNEGRSQRASLRERLHKLVQDRSPYDQGILQVSSPDEDQGSIRYSINASHGGEVYRPRNNQS
ncbi:Ifi-6-16 domain-containing protein [Rhizoctonia solani AG-1 IA]|uniref:Ifi-6-16 domain-containing protein n=1 Tax=Thanatephorus cucumeris (strain AG1-IA) TaxID=983506 RepID=L8WMC0_THACA|nr:Ifi-6-16 domain-containing protein [Rhizoctonia solani AG-1 IA]